MNAIKLTKVQFSNRELFERSVDIVLNVNTRLNCGDPLDVHYADMEYVFWNEFHADRAIVRLREKGIDSFNVERDA